MWTGHNTTYAGIRHGVFQFDLSALPANAYIMSAQVTIFKQADFLDPLQADTWSCNLIDYTGDLFATATYAGIHGAGILATLTPTWTTATLIADASGTMYILTPPSMSGFNPGGVRASLLTFRLDGATTGDSIMSWDTGFRQDLGSLGVCYRPQLTITYAHIGDVKFDLACYPPEGPLTLTLTDQDLAGTGTASAVLTSKITGDSENISLEEVGSTGVFTASFPCDPALGMAPNDGILFVVERDTITATYNDASPAGVRTDTTRICGAIQSSQQVSALSICPLARNNIKLAQSLKEEAQELLKEAKEKGLDTAAVEEILAQADEYLKKAEQFCLNSTNCIAGNWNALKAMELYQQAIDELKKLLGK